MNLEEIQEKIAGGQTIEEIVTELDWKEFEDFCAKILEEHEWKVTKNFRFKTESRYEIDILATKSKNALAIDCKRWDNRKGKASQLKIAAIKQLERVKEMKKIKFLFVDYTEIFPILITWFEENITKEEGVWIVPIFKFNNFLLETNRYLESI